MDFPIKVSPAVAAFTTAISADPSHCSPNPQRTGVCKIGQHSFALVVSGSSSADQVTSSGSRLRLDSSMSHSSRLEVTQCAVPRYSIASSRFPGSGKCEDWDLELVKRGKEDLPDFCQPRLLVAEHSIRPSAGMALHARYAVGAITVLVSIIGDIHVIAGLVV